MAHKKIIKTVTLLMLIMITCWATTAQSFDEYPILKKYRKWGITAGPVIYNRAELLPRYGEYTFENKPMWGFNAGLEYDFYPHKKWSVITGLTVALEPIYKVEYTIMDEDIYPHFGEDITDIANDYAMTSFSSPLLLRLNIQVNEKTFFNFRTGLKVMYFPSGSASLTVSYASEDQEEVREVFGLRVDSPIPFRVVLFWGQEAVMH
jgi:outer membrane protein with beta-barrel domain